mgnify:CR=1 FL=1
MSFIHAVTNKPIEPSKITCGDGTYTMYPDNTKIWFQRISFNGEDLLQNGEIGSGTTGPGRVMDQRCFKSDILYCVENYRHTSIIRICIFCFHLLSPFLYRNNTQNLLKNLFVELILIFSTLLHRPKRKMRQTYLNKYCPFCLLVV